MMTKATLRDLNYRRKKEMDAFEASHDAAHLQKAADILYAAIDATHGEHVAVLTLQAAGWPRPWLRSFSFPPPTGDKTKHDSLVFDMLTDISDGLGPLEDLPEKNTLALLDRVLIRRNRRNSPFRAFGKAAGSGCWPFENHE